MLGEARSRATEPIRHALAADPERLIGDSDGLDAERVVDADLRLLKAVAGDDGLGLGGCGLGLGEGARTRGERPGVSAPSG